MTFEQFLQRLQEIRAATDSAQGAIVTFSRSLVPTLRDAGREHAAKELERLLFEVDAHAGELSEHYRNHMDLLLKMLSPR